MLTILDRYILKEFFKKFGALFLLFGLILLLKDILGELGYVLSKEPEFLHVILFFVNRLPIELIQVVPISVILAIMFSIGSMAKRKEVLAIHASGVSYTRMAIPLALAVFSITLMVFAVNEYVVPGCWVRARYLEKVEINRRSESVLTKEKDITTKGKGNRFYAMKSFESSDRRKRMERPIITDVMVAESGHRTIRFRIDAKYADLLKESENRSDILNPEFWEIEKGEHFWRFYDATVMMFDKEGRLIAQEVHEQVDIPMEEDLDRFLATNKREAEMNFAELGEFVAIQGERNQGEYYRRLKTQLHAKLAFPLATFLLGMIGYSFAVHSSIRSLVWAFGKAILCVVLWYTFFGSADRLGRMGFVHPALAAWYGNILFAGFLLWRFHVLERVPRG